MQRGFSTPAILRPWTRSIDIQPSLPTSAFLAVFDDRTWTLRLTTGRGGADAKRCMQLLAAQTLKLAPHLRSIETAGSVDFACSADDLRAIAGLVGRHRFVSTQRGKRQTSYVQAQLVAMQHHEVSQLKTQEVRVERIRASGPGGQHRNKRDTAVALTHLPTGLTATITRGRSQRSNYEQAWQLLQQRLDTQGQTGALAARQTLTTDQIIVTWDMDTRRCTLSSGEQLKWR